MNEHLSNEIFELVLKMDSAERTAFKQFVKNKKQDQQPGTNNYKYQQLFDLYTDQQKQKLKEVNIPALQKAAKGFTTSLDDLNQQLFGRLEKFMAVLYRNKNAFAEEYQVSELLDAAEAFRERSRNKAADSCLVRAAELLNALRKKTVNKQRLMYLSIRLAALQWEIRLVEKLNAKKKIELEEFEKEARPFLTLAKHAHEHIVKPVEGQLEVFSNPEFQLNAFYALLGIYLRERKAYDTLFKTVGRRARFGNFTRAKHQTDQQDDYAKRRNALMEKIIDTDDVLMQVEKLFYAVKVNDEYGFDDMMYALLHHIHSWRSAEKYNSELAAFVYRQLFELKVLFRDDEPAPTDVYQLKELDRLTKRNLQLFTDEEVVKIPLRIELNTLVIYFVNKEYKKVVALLEELKHQALLNKYASYYPDVILAEIISRTETQYRSDELDKRIRYYQDYTSDKKNIVPPFHKKFDDFIFHYLDRTTDRKAISQKYLAKIEPLKESFNHFHHIFLEWLRSKC